MLELSSIAIKALNRAMPQTTPNFSNKEQRDFIMQGLFRAINLQNEDLQRDAIQAVCEVPYVGYDCIGEYVQ